MEKTTNILDKTMRLIKRSKIATAGSILSLGCLNWVSADVFAGGLYPDNITAFDACLAEYTPLRKFSWSSNPIRCTSIAPNTPDVNETPFNAFLYSVVTFTNLFTSDIDQEAWHTSCTNLEIWFEQEGNKDFISCSENWFYAEAACKEPYIYNSDSSMCEAYCPEGVAWIPALEKCEEVEKPDSCEAQGSEPIDFVDGGKYRTIKALSVGTIFPIDLKFYYNSNTNQEKTIAGKRPLTAIPRVLVASVPPVASDSLNDVGYPLALMFNPAQHYSPLRRYWRHNYEESLIQDELFQFTWLKGSGSNIRIENGRAVTDPSIRLVTINTPAHAFNGHQLQFKNGLKKSFDDKGRLRRVENAKGIYHELAYGSNGHLTSITHSILGSLTFTYDTYPITTLQGGAVGATAPYVRTITDHAGRTVELNWAPVEVDLRTYHVIQRITHPSTSTPTSAREYLYNNPIFGMAITDIFDVTDIATNTKTLYAHFEYDALGRGIASSLAQGKSGYSVEYLTDTTRRVTNSFGKGAVYTFGEHNGITRLDSVLGEASANCVPSNTSYTYNAEGQVETKTQNGRTTRYEYNTRGLRTRVQEAFGTPLEKSIETIWHPTFSLPQTVIEPHRTTNYDYHPNGQLRTRTVTNTVNP